MRKKPDPLTSGGARIERRAWMDYLDRKKANGQRFVKVSSALRFGRTRRLRYEKRPGGL